MFVSLRSQGVRQQIHHTSVLLGTMFVAVGLRTSGRTHSIIVHQTVSFVLRVRVQLVVLGVPDDVVGLDDARPSRFVQGSLQLVQRVLAQYLIVEFSTAFTIKGKSLQFAHGMLLPRLITIVLWTSRTKFHNGIVSFEFPLKISQVVAQHWSELSQPVEKNNRVGVKIQHALV